VLELDRVSGGYPGGFAVNEVSLTFAPGKITVLLGPNGCGKSTLLKLASGQLTPSSGAVQLEGRPLSSLDRITVARSVAYLPQSRTTPDISVETYVMHGRFPWLGYPRIYRAGDRAIARQALERLGILPLRQHRLPQLSGGERQKAYLAMLLAQTTPTLLLDEPGTYLDITHQLELNALLRALAEEGKAVVTVLHDLNAALEYGDELVVMRDGQLSAQGNPAQILETKALEQAFGIQINARQQYGFSL
jgi:iron complex transport system ATP-binding protein